MSEGKSEPSRLTIESLQNAFNILSDEPINRPRMSIVPKNVHDHITQVDWLEHQCDLCEWARWNIRL